MTAKTLLGLRDAAQRLNRCEGTVKRWCDEGRLDHTRDSTGKRLFDPDVLDRFRPPAIGRPRRRT